MALIDLVNENIASTPDPVCVAADSECKLRIIEVTYKDSDKNGNSGLLVRFEITDEPLAKDFIRYFTLPSAAMDEKKRESSKRGLKHFGEAFGIDFQRPFEVEELVGLEGWAILGVEANEQFGDQNYIKRFVTGA